MVVHYRGIREFILYPSLDFGNLDNYNTVVIIGCIVEFCMCFGFNDIFKDLIMYVCIVEDLFYKSLILL